MKQFFAWWKEHDRIYAAIFWMIQLSVLALAAAAWYFWGWPYGIVALIWLRSNAYNYAVGSQRFIDDELESSYPELGIKEMFKSWRRLLPVFAIVSAIIFLLLRQ